MWILMSVYFLLVPAIAFAATPAFLIATHRVPLPYRLIALAGYCVAMLPIRMWETILMVVAASISGTLTRAGLDWIERTRVRAFAANPVGLMLVAMGVYATSNWCMEQGAASPTSTLIPAGALRWLEWCSIGLLIVVGVPRLIIRLKRGEKRRQSQDVKRETISRRFQLWHLLICVMAIAVGFAAMRVAWPRCDYFACWIYLAIGGFVGCAIVFFAWLIRLGHSFVLLPFCLLQILFVAAVLAEILHVPEQLSFRVSPWTLPGLTQFLIGVGGAAIAWDSLRRLQVAEWLRIATRAAIGVTLVVVLLPTIRIYRFMYRPNMTLPHVERVAGNRHEDLVTLMEQLDPTLPQSQLTSVIDKISAIANSDAPIVETDLEIQTSGIQRATSRAFVDDASRLALQGKTPAALDRLFTCILLNQRFAMGGVVIDRLVQFACNDIPLNALYGQRRQWNAAELELVQTRMTEAAQFAEAIDLVNQRSRALDEVTYSWFDGLVDYDVSVLQFDGIFSNRLRDRKPQIRTARFVMENAVWIDLLIADCAIRRFLIDHGKPPRTLHELVPNYLTVVPLDPFADKHLSYRAMGTNYELYSFAHNKKDDGGLSSRFDGDIVLRSK